MQNNEKSVCVRDRGRKKRENTESESEAHHCIFVEVIFKKKYSPPAIIQQTTICYCHLLHIINTRIAYSWWNLCLQIAHTHRNTAQKLQKRSADSPHLQELKEKKEKQILTKENFSANRVKRKGSGKSY